MSSSREDLLSAISLEKILAKVMKATGGPVLGPEGLTGKPKDLEEPKFQTGKICLGPTPEPKFLRPVSRRPSAAATAHMEKLLEKQAAQIKAKEKQGFYGDLWARKPKFLKEGELQRGDATGLGKKGEHPANPKAAPIERLLKEPVKQVLDDAQKEVYASYRKNDRRLKYRMRPHEFSEEQRQRHNMIALETCAVRLRNESYKIQHDIVSRLPKEDADLVFPGMHPFNVPLNAPKSERPLGLVGHFERNPPAEEVAVRAAIAGAGATVVLKEKKETSNSKVDAETQAGYPYVKSTHNLEVPKNHRGFGRRGVYVNNYLRSDERDTRDNWLTEHKDTASQVPEVQGRKTKAEARGRKRNRVEDLKVEEMNVEDFEAVAKEKGWKFNRAAAEEYVGKREGRLPKRNLLGNLQIKTPTRKRRRSPSPIDDEDMIGPDGKRKRFKKCYEGPIYPGKYGEVLELRASANNGPNGISFVPGVQHTMGLYKPLVQPGEAPEEAAKNGLGAPSLGTGNGVTNGVVPPGRTQNTAHQNGQGAMSVVIGNGPNGGAQSGGPIVFPPIHAQAAAHHRAVSARANGQNGVAQQSGPIVFPPIHSQVVGRTENHRSPAFGGHEYGGR